MKLRRKSREVAIQVLYSFIKNKKSIDDIFEDEFFAKTSMKSREYAIKIVEGVIFNEKEYDKMISKLSINWNIKRIALVDKIILKIALYEIMQEDTVPAAVAINEALEVAKKFSTKDSSKFINGILDKYNKSLT